MMTGGRDGRSRALRASAGLVLVLAGLGAGGALLRADSASDERIKLRIQNKLLGQVSVRLEDFRLEVKEGAVRLIGSVASAGERATVERLVGGLSGVASISNELTVRPSDRSELAIAEEVRRLLERRTRFRRMPIEVSVSGTEVTLGGTTEKAIDRFDAEVIAAGAQGVTRVVNNIRVQTREQVPPETVRKRVVGVLENPLTFGVIRDLEVTVDDGVVLLRGVAGREADRAQAERLALGVPGVTSVKNLITVAGP